MCVCACICVCVCVCACACIYVYLCVCACVSSRCFSCQCTFSQQALRTRSRRRRHQQMNNSSSSSSLMRQRRSMNTAAAAAVQRWMCDGVSYTPVTYLCDTDITQSLTARPPTCSLHRLTSAAVAQCQTD